MGLGLAGFNICFLVVRWRASTHVTALGLGLLLALPLPLMTLWMPQNPLSLPLLMA